MQSIKLHYWNEVRRNFLVSLKLGYEFSEP